MKRKLAIISAAIVTVVTLAASAAELEDNSAMQNRMAAMAIRRFEQRLNITDDQRASLRAVVKSEQPAIQALAQRVREENEQLRSQPYDEAQVRAFAREHEATREDVLVEREKIRSEVMEILTPAQRETLKQMREQRSGAWLARLASLGDQL